MSEIRVLCCGSRNWRDYAALKKVLRTVLAHVDPKDVIIIHGAQETKPSDGSPSYGADFLWNKAAKELGYQVESYPVDWTLARRLYGRNFKKAGPLRNSTMLGREPHAVLAAHDDPNLGKGTRDMVQKAVNKGITTLVYQHTDDGGVAGYMANLGMPE